MRAGSTFMENEYTDELASAPARGWFHTRHRSTYRLESHGMRLARTFHDVHYGLQAHDVRSIHNFLRAESFFTLATEIERLDDDPGADRIINAYGGRSLHEQSHGESFFALFKNRFRGQGLYLMDEPEAALSPRRQLEFLALLHDFCTQGSQFLIATHSPIIMAYPDGWIYVLDQEGIRRVPYAETDHYLVTRGFLSNPQRSLDVLLASGDAE